MLMLTEPRLIIVCMLGESQFGLYSVGESLRLYCTDIFGSANLVQWLDSTGTVLASSSSAVTLNINLITDRHNGLEYTCRIQSFGSSRDLNYTSIVISEFFIMYALITVTLLIPCSTTSSCYSSNQPFQYWSSNSW